MKRKRSTAARPAASPLYETRDSPIHGKGLFAARTIPKGTLIIEYGGRRITREQAAVGYVEGPETHTFLFELSDGTLIDAAQDGTDARWINHSCAPNCKTVEKDMRIWIRATRRIRTGEELSYDYNITMEDDEQSSWPCRCGAKRCRRTLADLKSA